MLLPDTADLFARVIWAEARSQGQAGMEAVACVVMNRARNPRWWGSDARSVLLKPWQFSCLQPEPVGQLKLLKAVTAADSLFRQAQAIATAALAGGLVDHTKNADTYANLHICSPAWAQGRTPVAVIGAHSFFRLELHPPIAVAPAPPIQHQLHAGAATRPALRPAVSSQHVAQVEDPETARLNDASLTAALGSA